MRARQAFSLAELMIALGILGIGLLFIAAALPVGVDYTRQSVDRASGDAAAREAAKVIEARLRTSANITSTDPRYGASPPALPLPRLDGVSRPRHANTTTGAFAPAYPTDEDAGGPIPERDYEPFIKVRPLVMQNVHMQPRGELVVDDVETVIGRYVNARANVLFGTPAPLSGAARLLEYDLILTEASTLSLEKNPVIPCTARVYPPIVPVGTATIFDLLTPTDPAAGRFAATPVTGNTAVNFSEPTDAQRVMDQRIGWCAFYRRASYDRVLPGADNLYVSTDDIIEPGDPLLYEIIIVVTRRPSATDRFPRQRFDGSGVTAQLSEFDQPRAVVPGGPGATAGAGADRALPMPWLVLFDTSRTAANDSALPVIAASAAPTPGDYDEMSASRSLWPGFAPAPEMTFRCKPELGKLLAPGSIIIPAANDDFPAAIAGPLPATAGVGAAGSLGPANRANANLGRRAGFVPHQPSALPIYTVKERPDDTTIIVDANGLYPWVSQGAANGRDASLFPCWVIPPAFAERTTGTQREPVYYNHTSIVAVTRHLVRLPEVR